MVTTKHLAFKDIWYQYVAYVGILTVIMKEFLDMDLNMGSASCNVIDFSMSPCLLLPEIHENVSRTF